MNRRALVQTIVDGRHEWTLATTTTQRLLAAVRFVSAVVRVLAFLIVMDASKALATTFVRSWLAGTSALSTAVWILISLRHSYPPAKFYIVDLGEIFMTLAMPIFLLLSLARRREGTVPRVGTAAVVSATMALWLFVLLPLGLASRYVVAFHGRVYAPVPWFMVAQWMLAAAVFALAAMALADRVVVHDRRAFLASLSVFVPLALMMLTANAQADLAPLIAGWRIAPYALFSMSAIFGLSIVWVGLKWESYANSHEVGDASR